MMLNKLIKRNSPQPTRWANMSSNNSDSDWRGGGKGEGFFLLKYIYAMQLKLLTCALIPHVSNQFYPIWFAQSSPFVTHISRPKGSHYSFSWKSLFCGGLCFRFFFRDRPIKMIHCLKKQKSLGFKPYLSP